MKKTWRYYLKETGNFLFGERGRKVLVFLFCIAISTGFWAVTALRDTFEVELRVPMQLVDVPDAVRITTELPSEVIVSVRDKGTTLVSYLRRGSLRPLTFSFEDYDNGSVSGRGQIPLTDVRTAMLHQLDATTTIQSLRPDTLEFFYNRGLHYRLPVRVQGTFTTTPQNYLRDVEATPDSVDVFAPANVLDTMRYAKCYRELSAKSIIINANLKYMDKNRKNLSKSYPSFKKFKAEYEVPQELIDDIFAEGEKQDIRPKDDEERQKTIQNIQLIIKGLVARDLWDMSEYFAIIYENDDVVRKAVELLQN